MIISLGTNLRRMIFLSLHKPQNIYVRNEPIYLFSNAYEIKHKICDLRKNIKMNHSFN